jgi:glycosyltransferase involved in cell wall biosynthesis
MKAKIVKIDINDKIYGGRVYENEFIRLLEGEIEFERVFIMRHKTRILNIFRMFVLLVKYKFFFSGTLLLTNATTFFAGFRAKNIVVVHHIDSKFSPNPIALYNWMCNKYLCARKSMFDKVVVVAEVWKQVLLSRGFKNVVKIYNSFNSSDYQFSEAEKQNFKDRYGLNGKPIIYLGNCQALKGAKECYARLKDMNAYLVTSGIKDIDIPTIHLTLPFNDYKLLLASADIVLTMSLFLEGWNRTAHEASLCGTPVIGSGSGGMKELLIMAGQTISDQEHLKENVIKAIGTRIAPTKEILSLNLQYFKTEWSKVFNE